MKLTTIKNKSSTPQKGEQTNALTVIDGIVGALSRGGPGRELTFTFPKGKTPTWLAKLGDLPGFVKITPTEWKVTGCSAKEALYFARANLEVLNDALPKIGTLPLEDQLDLFLRIKEWPRSDFTKFAKYTTAWPMARYLKQQLPEKPEGFSGNPLVFGGKIRRILKNRLISTNDKNLSLWTGYLQGVKRGAAPVSDDFVLDSMNGHREKMLAIGRFDFSESVALEPLVDKVFTKFEVPHPELYEASTSASWQAKRSCGGARGWLRDLLVREDSTDHLIKMIEISPGVVREMRGVVVPPFNEALQMATASTRAVMVSAVLEPLKVRLITKGDTLRYWVSRFFQKGLWKHLQKYSQFVLTGRPMEIKDLSDLLEKESKIPFSLNFDKWVSGDYKAATDGVSIHYTKLVFESVLKKTTYSDELKDVLRSVLYEQDIHYPAKYGLDPCRQVNGQLMGSVLSFPVLCVINLIAYWKSLEEYSGLEIDAENLPVLINGDDILFRSNVAHYEIWQKWIKAVGFTLSLGKNYIHDNVLTINSQTYRHIRGTSDFKRIGFLNTGLLTSQSKVTGRDNAKLAPIWDYYNEIVGDSNQPSRTHRRFIHYNRSKIEQCTNFGNYNLFLPFERGGLGFIPSVPVAYTSFQRRFARYLEEKFLKSVEDGVAPRREQIGIVRTNAPPSGSFSRHHVPRLLLQPLIGPLEKGLIDLKTNDVFQPPLVSAHDPERPEVKIRLPRKAVLKDFRLQRRKRMSDWDISVWPFQLKERKGLEDPLLPPPSIEELEEVADIRDSFD
jgi:hypothetical protein